MFTNKGIETPEISIPLTNLKIPKIRITQNRRNNEVGQVPGSYDTDTAAVSSKIFGYAYNATELDEFQTESTEELKAFLKKFPDRTYWLDIKGLGSKNVLEFVKSSFNINPLVLEDIVNTYQRPKMEDYEDYIFVVSRMMEMQKGLDLKNEQLSFLLLPNILISFQEDYDDVLEPVRTRLRKNLNGNMRLQGSSYLLYAIMDMVLDHYFTITNRMGDELEIIEDHLYTKPRKLLMFRIQGIKKLIMTLRRATWSERDKLSEISRHPSKLINPEAKVFYRDAYDHSIQMMELLENMRENATSLLDLYLSLISNKMNEVMKTLTIISAIFIPLTFIAGIYGMNFSYQDPKTGKILPNNMPELYHPNGYVYVMVFMGIIVFFQIWYFARKGWFRD